jgi:hypothetical protein
MSAIKGILRGSPTQDFTGKTGGKGIKAEYENY